MRTRFENHCRAMPQTISSAMKGCWGLPPQLTCTDGKTAIMSERSEDGC
jgi:hypothetical protein